MLLHPSQLQRVGGQSRLFPSSSSSNISNMTTQPLVGAQYLPLSMTNCYNPTECIASSQSVTQVAATNGKKVPCILLEEKNGYTLTPFGSVNSNPAAVSQPVILKHLLNLNLNFQQLPNAFNLSEETKSGYASETSSARSHSSSSYDIDYSQHYYAGSSSSSNSRSQSATSSPMFSSRSHSYRQDKRMADGSYASPFAEESHLSDESSVTLEHMSLAEVPVNRQREYETEAERQAAAAFQYDQCFQPELNQFLSVNTEAEGLLHQSLVDSILQNRPHPALQLPQYVPLPLPLPLPLPVPIPMQQLQPQPQVQHHQLQAHLAQYLRSAPVAARVNPQAYVAMPQTAAPHSHTQGQSAAQCVIKPHTPRPACSSLPALTAQHDARLQGQVHSQKVTLESVLEREYGARKSPSHFTFSPTDCEKSSATPQKVLALPPWTQYPPSVTNLCDSGALNIMFAQKRSAAAIAAAAKAAARSPSPAAPLAPESTNDAFSEEKCMVINYVRLDSDRWQNNNGEVGQSFRVSAPRAPPSSPVAGAGSAADVGVQLARGAAMVQSTTGLPQSGTPSNGFSAHRRNSLTAAPLRHALPCISTLQLPEQPRRHSFTVASLRSNSDSAAAEQFAC